MNSWKENALKELEGMKKNTYSEADNLFSDISALNIPANLRNELLALIMSRGVIVPTSSTGWAHFSPVAAIDAVIEKIRNF